MALMVTALGPWARSLSSSMSWPSATETLREMEREPGRRRTPVIMLTAKALDGRLAKSIRADALIDAIGRAVLGRPCACLGAGGSSRTAPA